MDTLDGALGLRRPLLLKRTTSSIDQDVILRRGEASRHGAGLMGSVINSMIRIYYFVRDEQHTQQARPFVLHKGQIETVRFPTPLAAGEKLAVFSRGAEVNISSFGNLGTDTPFLNRALDASQARSSSDGFNINGTGPAKVIAFYTPPAEVAAT